MSDLKSPIEMSKAEPDSITTHSVTDVVATPLHSLETNFNRFLGFFEKLSIKLGAETTGCERISEEDRDETQGPWSMFSVWTTANLLVSAFSTGSLGPLIYGLGFWDSFLCIIFFHAVGDIAVGIYSFMSFQLGMRSMIIARYSFGYWSVKIMVTLNALTCIGWLIINTVSASNIFYDAADGHVPLTASNVIIMVLSLVMSFFGYKAIHVYDRYAWMCLLVVFCILAGFGAKHFVNIPMAQGQAAVAGVLAYGATIFSWGILWFPLAADYSVYMPVKTSKLKTFACTYIGLWTSCVITFTLGCAFGTLAFSEEPLFTAAYASRGLGGLVGSVFEGYGGGVRGFGRFIQLILSLSIVGGNIPNIYSCGLSTQAVASWLLKVPRILITLFMFAIALVLSIVAQDHVVEVLSSLMNCLAYWCTPFAMVVLTEHFYFRRNVGYNAEGWNEVKQLPPGLAAITAWACGVAVSVVSMDQTWYVGPIAKSIGTDIAFELALGITPLVYIVLRSFEIKYSGR